jgi:Homeodomain-like domain
MDLLASLSAAAESYGLELDIADLLVLTAAFVRITVDGEDPARVVGWAKQEMGLPPAIDYILGLRASGASVRRIAAITGLPKSTVQRWVSHAAA